MGHEQATRLVTTTVVEADNALLLTQLAKGPFAGFWLLPSTAVDAGTVQQTARRMVIARTGYPVVEQQLAAVLEETRPGLLILRFLFRAKVGARECVIDESDIAQARFFSRQAVRDVLEERDIVPNLAVMSVVRSWLEGTALEAMHTLDEAAFCPCGSGFRFTGCCGWDHR